MTLVKNPAGLLQSNDPPTSQTKTVMKISIPDWIVAIILSTASNIYNRVLCALLIQHLSLQRRVRQASRARIFRHSVQKLR